MHVHMYILQPYHYNKEVVAQGFVQVEYVRTAMNIADLYTKPVTLQTLQALVGKATGYQDIDYTSLGKLPKKQHKDDVPKSERIPMAHRHDGW